MASQSFFSLILNLTANSIASDRLFVQLVMRISTAFPESPFLRYRYAYSLNIWNSPHSCAVWKVSY